MRIFQRLRAARQAISEALARIEAKKRRDDEDLLIIATLRRQLSGEKTLAEATGEAVTRSAQRTREVWEARGIFAESQWSSPAHLRQKALEFMRLYNEALAALVEGQREVLHNDDFVFEDGECTKAKEDKFRNFIESSGRRSEVSSTAEPNDDPTFKP